MIITIDTSTGTAGLAVTQDEIVLAELSWHCGQNHTTQLLPALSFVLKQLRLPLSNAQGIVVARGPGSYNGLRVGLSTAKGLAYSLNIPLVSISTLAAVSYQAASTVPGLPVCAVMNAGRGEIAAAVYHQNGSSWLPVVPEHLATVASLCTSIETATVFCGEYLPAVSAEIQKRLGGKAILISGAALVRRASFLAELGSRRLQAHDYDDPVALQPLYLRAPSITQPKEPYLERK
jgi:tRNA threonylcarbamoyl adenosine modification protein YeaZ